MKTPERVAADAALESALDAVAVAYGWDGLRVAWSIVVHNVVYSDAGDQATAVQWHGPDNQTWVTTLGLLRAITLRLEGDFMTPDAEEA